MGQRIGTADSATPHADPSGGQAPALHFLIPPSAIGLQFGTFRRWRAGIEVDWRAHPGSESGTCFRSNRPCRLVPAHQGMKMRPSRWKCLGVIGATPPLWIPAFAGMTKGSRVTPFSYQSLMPAGAGTPRYENPELWLGPANWHGGFCDAPPRPQRGTSPRATFSHSANGHRSTIRHVSTCLPSRLGSSRRPANTRAIALRPA